MHDLAGKKVEVKPATPRGSGPQGRGGGPPPDRPAFRGPPPSPSGRSIGSAFASGTPAAQHPGPYSYSPGAPGMAFAPGPMVNPYTGMGYQMPYYSSMMLQQMGPYAYGTFGYAPQYSSQQQFQLPGQAPPPSPAAFDRQSQLPIGPTGMGPFGPGPGPGYGRGAGPPRFPSGSACHSISCALHANAELHEASMPSHQPAQAFCTHTASFFGRMRCIHELKGHICCAIEWYRSLIYGQCACQPHEQISAALLTSTCCDC